MEKSTFDSKGTPRGSGESKEEMSQAPKSLLDRATEINTKYKMIAKSTDGVTLTDAETAVKAMISEVQSRIDQIKAEGSQSSHVPTQQILYAEYKGLDVQLDRLKKKKDGIEKARTELTDEQKKFFGIPVEKK